MCLFIRRRSNFAYRQLDSADTLAPRTTPAIQLVTTPYRMGVSASGTPPPESRELLSNPASASPAMVGLPSQFSAQHERLILELLPFKDSGRFHEWLRGDLVRGSWAEFHRDFLCRVPAGHADPDKAKTAQAVKDAINSRSQKFLVYHPDKTAWSPEDHHVRFMVVLIKDNLLTSLWSESDWKRQNVEICKAVYEVLFFLKASYYMNEQNPPRYSQ